MTRNKKKAIYWMTCFTCLGSAKVSVWYPKSPSIFYCQRNGIDMNIQCWTYAYSNISNKPTIYLSRLEENMYTFFIICNHWFILWYYYSGAWYDQSRIYHTWIWDFLKPYFVHVQFIYTKNKDGGPRWP